MEEHRKVTRVNAVVSRFYRTALDTPLNRHREAILQELDGIISFDAAMWGIGDAEAERFHGLALLGLQQRCSRLLLERAKDIKPRLSALLGGPDKPKDSAAPIPDHEFYKSDIYAKICEPLRIQQALGTSHLDSRSRLHNLIVLFRFDRKPRFTPAERRLQRHLVFHLTNASSLAYLSYLRHTNAGSGTAAAAICDHCGTCHDAQPSFTSLIAEKYPGWPGHRLPFALPDPDREEPTSVRGLQVLAEPVLDRVCVRVWKQGPMDLLTKRERQIVTSVCQGLSYKEVARPLGIAPSTVSNHLYRVFDKVGVSSRAELAKMVSRSY